MKSIAFGATVALLGAVAAGSASAQIINSSADGRNIIVKPVASQSAAQPSAAQMANAKSRLPMLKDLSQVPGFGGVQS